MYDSTKEVIKIFLENKGIHQRKTKFMKLYLHQLDKRIHFKNSYTNYF